MKQYSRLQSEPSLRQHKGIFRKELTLWEATALLVPIGAGVLGIPYAVSQVGLTLGIAYIIIIGFLMIGMHLLVGEIMVRTKGNKQLVGLAKKYLGTTGEIMMAILAYVMQFGALLVYIIGVGKALAIMLPGTPLTWSIVFFIIATILVFIGLRTIKKVELFLVLGILAVVLVIAFFAAPHIAYEHVIHHNMAALLLPYGVMMFAFHGMSSIPEAHSLLLHKDKLFKKSLIYSGLIAMGVYIVFAFTVVGVTGTQTTEIATIGLGKTIGPFMLILGNLFAVLAMGMSFLTVGLSLRDSFMWDWKLSQKLATTLVCGVPFLFFILGLRQFIAALDIVGGVFGSIELLLFLLIYWRAKHLGDLPAGKYKLHHTALLGALLFLAFAFGAFYSVIKFF